MTEYNKPKRYFEKSGVVDPKASYYVPLENVTNMDNQDIKTMVDYGRYFSIFAPRQSGKTTFFEGFCSQLEHEPNYIPILLSFQYAKSLDSETFYSRIQEDLFEQLAQRLESVNCAQKDLVKDYLASTNIKGHTGFYDFFKTLNRLIKSKKIVIFIDEFDGIPLHELEDFLTTLRELYQKYKKRTDKALYSVGLVGIRNITKLIVGGVSPFNIADQVSFPPFSLKNVHDLYGQYTNETNQPFTEGAVEKVYEETGGQPWLVNRLGTILTINIRPETIEAITGADVEKGVEMLLYEENSHFDNITEKAKQLKETFIEIVFDGVEYVPGNEEQSLLLTHGLIKANGKYLFVSNPIYKSRFTKIFFREAGTGADIAHGGYFTTDGFLDMAAILSDFEEYIIQIGVNAFYTNKKPYEKTGQFLLTAWLYQFVEGGKGELHYEIPTGLGRMDILLTYRGKKYIIETKINRSNINATIDRAVEQICGKYLLTEKALEGYVVVFDVKTKVGDVRTPQKRQVEGNTILIFEVGIGRSQQYFGFLLVPTLSVGMHCGCSATVTIRSWSENVFKLSRPAVAALRGEGEEDRVKVLRGGFVTSKQLFLFIFGLITLLGCRHCLANTYPESTDLLQELAAKVILEMEEKAAWRFVPGQGDSEKFVKIPWRSGDRQTILFSCSLIQIKANWEKSRLFGHSQHNQRVERMGFPLVLSFSFPCSAWECIPEGSASHFIKPTALSAEKIRQFFSLCIVNPFILKSTLHR